jgi:hypothetical protein
MQTIDKASPLYARYLQKLTEQETKLESLVEQAKAANTALKTAQEMMTGYVANLNVE